MAVWREHGVPIGTTEAIIGSDTSILLVNEVGASVSLPIECPSTLEKADMEGEMWVSGHPIALGYISPAGFTELLSLNGNCSQSPQPQDSYKWFKTGDICAVLGNHLYFCGRRDRLVKIRGLRIQLEAIERAVSQALTDLGNYGQCQVVAFDVDVETKYGFNHRQLIVCIAKPAPSTKHNKKVPSSRDTLSFSSDPRKADICRWIAAKYGPASVPHAICTIPSGAVDRLPSGKLDRREFAMRYVKSLRAVSNSSGDPSADPISEYVKMQLQSLLQINDREWQAALSSTLAALGVDSLLTTLFHFELQQQFPALTISSTELVRTRDYESDLEV
jgi:acyl-CoA synthetase (AMP-forming)/AMP-acid ligase II